MRHRLSAFRALIVIAVLGRCALGCRSAPTRPEFGPIAPEPSCPREAARSTSGRCACTPGHVVVLGACLPPHVADRYCGPGATLRSSPGKQGQLGEDAQRRECAFRSCTGAREALDVVTGACVSPAAPGLAGPPVCGEGTVAIVEEGRPECVSAANTCPRGTRREAGATAGACVGPPMCPPGTLLGGEECRPVVVVGVRNAPRVDVGSWAALVLGPDEGDGSEELCRPMALRPSAFGVPRGSAIGVRLRISILVPDQDVSRVRAEVRAEAGAAVARGTNPSSRNGAPHKALAPAAEEVVSSAMAPLIEALRGLGGESSAAAVNLTVRCTVASL